MSILSGARDIARSIMYGRSPDLPTQRKALAWPAQLGGTGGTGGDFGPGWLSDLFTDTPQLTASPSDLIDNSAVMACIGWGARNFPEAPLTVRRGDHAKSEEIHRHPLSTLVTRPNPYYSGILMWQATWLSFYLDGNAYWIKVRQGQGKGKPVQLWYEPHFTIRPSYRISEDPNEPFIGGYDLFRGGRWVISALGREDVVHFRNGLDPRNPRNGLSPLQAALREVFTDDQAALYTAAMLQNMGMPGVIISPADANGVISDPPKFKATYMANFTGRHRGEPMVSSDPIKIERLAFAPDEMMLDGARKVPEERICGLLGVNRMVAGLGPDPTYANMEQAREAAIEENIMPAQRLFTAELDAQLLPDVGDPNTEYCEFDVSQLRALMGDENAKASATATLYTAGVLMRSEARRRHNLAADPSDDVYATPPTTVAAGEPNMPTPATPPTPIVAPGASQALPEPTAQQPAKALTQEELETKALTQIQADLEERIRRRMEAHLARVYENVADHMEAA